MRMSEVQPSVPKERKGQIGVAPHASEAAVQGPPQRGQVARAYVGQLAPLDVAPHLFDGIELWGIARQALDVQPAPLRGA